MSNEPPSDLSEWHGTGTILIAEDDDSVRSVLAQMLEALGFEVIAVANGREALDRFREQAANIRAALLDFSMPVLDGVLTLRELRRAAPSLPVLLMSGYHEDELRERVLDDAPSGILQKPFTSVDVVAKLRAALTRP